MVTPGQTPTPDGLPTTPLGEIAAQAESVAATLREIEAGLQADQVSASLRVELPELSRQISAQLEENSKVLAGHPSLDALRALESDWTTIAASIQAWKSQGATQAGLLDTQMAQLGDMHHTWEDNLKSAKGTAVPVEFRDRIEATLTQIDLTRSRVENRRSEVLRVQNRISEVDSRAARGLEAVTTARQATVKGLMSLDSPPLWSPLVRRQLGPELLANWRDSVRGQLSTLSDYAQHGIAKGLLHLCLFGFLVAALRWVARRVRPWALNDARLEVATRVFHTSISASLVISVFFSPWLYPQAPRMLLAILGAAALLPTVVVLRGLIQAELTSVLCLLTFFYFVDQVRVVAISIPVLARLIFCLEMLTGALFFWWILYTRRKALGWRWDATANATRLILALFLWALLANVFGHVNLANLVGNTVLRSAYLAVVLLGVTKIIEGLLFFALRTMPVQSLGVVRNHRRWLRRNLRRLTRFAVFAAWASATLDMLGLLSPLLAGSGEILEAQIGLGALHTSPRNVLACVLTIWGSFYLSRILRVVLDEDVYPRLELGRGLPYAVSTLLHYTILVVGLGIALAALGLETTKFAVVAGALGVGVGFGLQNIVNNFISGLILLFERPVKVGDIIQFGTYSGRLSQIGLRASILQVGDGSDVIIPNSQLISERVINWTMGDQLRRLDVTVSVAQDSEPERVIEILLKVAHSHTEILPDPQPEGLLTNFGESSLNFSLLAWTVSPVWLSVRSQILIQLKAELAQAGIVLSVPQCEVHLESPPSELPTQVKPPPDGDNE